MFQHLSQHRQTQTTRPMAQSTRMLRMREVEEGAEEEAEEGAEERQKQTAKQKATQTAKQKA